MEEYRSPDGHINRNSGIISYMMRLNEYQATILLAEHLSRAHGLLDDMAVTRCPVCQSIPDLTDDWSYSARGGAVIYYICQTPACDGRTISNELDHDEAVRALLNVPGPVLTLF